MEEKDASPIIPIIAAVIGFLLIIISLFLWFAFWFTCDTGDDDFGLALGIIGSALGIILLAGGIYTAKKNLARLR